MHGGELLREADAQGDDMKRAYRTTWNGVTSIVAAESVSQARARTTASANEAGYGAKWIEIRVVRAPEHDAWAETTKTGHAWDERFLPKGKEGST